jgi:hypothetical protein
MFTIDPIALLRLQYIVSQKEKKEEEEQQQHRNANPSIVVIHCW